MYVIKRNQNKEPVKFDKISWRIENLVIEFNLTDVDPVIITQKLSQRIFTGITTNELDNLASQICMDMISIHPNYGKLGGYIAVSNHQKNTYSDILQVVSVLNKNIDIKGKESSLINKEYFDIVNEYSKTLNNILDMNRDYLIDYFGFKTLERSYLLKVKDKIIERPQHLFLRVAVCIHGTDFENVKKTYDNISLKQYTMATPTLFNAGTNNQQLLSCFLTSIDDSIGGIFDTYRDCGFISKFAGGIGVHITNIRSKGSYIRGTNGKSDGILPLMRTFNSIARQINQGGKRLGSFAMYIEPHHADIFQFLDAKKNVGSDEERARDLFYALWIPDLFMEKVEKDEDWFLMDPNESLNLPDVYGEEYNNLYNKYVSEGKYIRKLKAREVWDAIITSQVETGMPYMCYKDNVNRKNNQSNIGVVKSSNLCVTGDTNILTSQGYFRIDKLVDREVEVWNGKTWSKTTVRKTGNLQKIIDVEFSNGVCVNCTPYHKFYIEDDEGKITVMDAKNLKSGMKIMKYSLPVVKLNDDEVNANDYERMRYNKFDIKAILNNESLKYRIL